MTITDTTPQTEGQQIYSALWIDYQRQRRTPEVIRADVDFIEAALKLPGPADVLDVACGEGCVAVELARRGHRVLGVEAQPELVEAARALAAEQKVKASFEARDARELPGEGRFGAAICLSGTFGRHDDAGNEALLARVAALLCPGGKLLLDTHVAETFLPRWSERQWQEVADVSVLRRRAYDVRTSRSNLQLILIRGDVTERLETSTRVYTYKELADLLEKAGFGSIEAYGTKQLDPFHMGSRRLFLVATRPG